MSYNLKLPPPLGLDGSETLACVLEQHSERSKGGITRYHLGTACLFTEHLLNADPVYFIYIAMFPKVCHATCGAYEVTVNRTPRTF